MGAVWLVFLYFPGMSLTHSSADAGWIALGWVGLVLFAITYVLGFVIGMRCEWQQPSRPVIVLFFIAIAWAALTIPAIGWDSTSFLPFLMAYAAYGIGTAWHWWSVGVSVTLVAVGSVIAYNRGSAIPWVLVGIVAMMAVVNTINTWLISRSVAADELRMDLATSEERESIARDVHDLLGHSLTVVKLKAELASRLLERDPAAARAELEEISRITGEAIAGVRSTVTGLRAHNFEQQLQLTRGTLQSAGISVTISGSLDALSPAQVIPAGWILREATTNILRHAQATRVSITIEPGVLTIEDNGVGVRTAPGNGVQGMIERAAGAGATLEITRATPGFGADASEGTKVSMVW